jgi:hypothetical protein
VRPLGRPRRRWEDNIKMDSLEVGGGRGDWNVFISAQLFLNDSGVRSHMLFRLGSSGLRRRVVVQAYSSVLEDVCFRLECCNDGVAMSCEKDGQCQQGANEGRVPLKPCSFLFLRFCNFS